MHFKIAIVIWHWALLSTESDGHAERGVVLRLCWGDMREIGGTQDGTARTLRR